MVPGDLTVRGVAWSGAAPVPAQIAVGAGHGTGPPDRRRHRHSWRWWELITRIDTTESDLRPRHRPGWSYPARPAGMERRGYGANALHAVPVQARTTDTPTEATR